MSGPFFKAIFPVDITNYVNSVTGLNLFLDMKMIFIELMQLGVFKKYSIHYQGYLQYMIPDLGKLVLGVLFSSVEAFCQW